MNTQEIEQILQQCTYKESEPYKKPTEKDWEILEAELQCRFCEEFKIFIDLMSEYDFPGEIFNVKPEDNNGNDTIAFVYAYERKYPEWDDRMIPFYGIGNGDYFCIHKETMQVYYYYHDRETFELEKETFGEWLADLPDFLE